MLIECPFCKATAKLPEEKEGAKVRCSGCGKVYVAREKGSKAKPGGVNGVTIGIGAGAVILIALFAFFTNQHKRKPPPPPPPKLAQAPEIVVDHVGWDSELVKLVRGLYDAAASYNEGFLVSSLDGAKIAAQASAAAPAPGASAPAPIDYAGLSPAEKQNYVLAIAQEFMRGSGDDSPHFWKPVDGFVLEPDLVNAVVRVTVDKRPVDGAVGIAETRTYDWSLSRPDQNAKWKVFAWKRFVSDSERRVQAAKKVKPVKVTLEDGTSLYQSELRHLEHLADTPPEVRARIDELIVTLLDFNLRPKENNLAQDELVAIGKPAIPMLLNKFYEIKIVEAEDDPSLTKINVVNGTLRRITGYDSGFTPLPGQNEQRRTMALKAWFAWWERLGQKFVAPKDQKDLLDDLIVPTERDKRELEKAKAKSGG